MDYHLLDARASSAREARAARRHGRDLRLVAARGAALDGAADPQRRPRRGERRRGDRGGSQGRARLRSRSTPRAAPRRRRAARTRQQLRAFFAARASGARGRASVGGARRLTVERPSRRRERRRGAGARRGRRASLRPLRRPVRAGDADAGAGGARAGVARRRARTRRTARSSTGCCATSPGARRRCITRGGSPSASGRPVYLKREDLNHTGSHKLNNALGQALLARRMGKRRVIAETGAGQHGVATATVVRAAGARVRHLHGRGGHAPPATERAADGAAGRDGASRSRPARGRSRRRPRRRSATG